MSVSELFRFRTVRPVQLKQSTFTALAVSSTLQQPNKNYIVQANAGPLTFLGPQFEWLQPVSESAAASADLLSPAALIALLPTTPTNWLAQILNPAVGANPPTVTAAWALLNQLLSDTLVSLVLQAKTTGALPGNYGIPVINNTLAQDIELVARLLLVQDCLTTLAQDQSLAAAQRAFQSATDVQTALSFRAVSLPKGCFTNNPATPQLTDTAVPVLARAPGVTDLSVVRSEWNRYVLGEIANVVNVLPGETLATRSRHMEETVQTQSTTDQQTTSQTTDNSQTTTQTLSSTATNDASVNIGVHGQVETSGQYGPTNVQTNVGAQAQFASSSSNSTSLTKSIQTVDRSVKTVAETITQAQSTRTTIKDTSHEKHSLQNPGTTVTVGKYRWLSEVQRVQLVNYPNRFIVEFELPEPGAWLKYALTNQPDAPWNNPDPGTFGINTTDARLDPNDTTPPDLSCTPLRPTDITPKFAAGLAARWRAQGVTAPPPQTIVLGNSYAVSSQTGPITSNDNTISIPDGYKADLWWVDVAFEGGNDNQHDTVVRIGVGASAATFTVTGVGASLLASGNQSAFAASQKLGATTGVIPTSSGPVSSGSSSQSGIPIGNLNTGTIPVYAYGHYVGGDYPGSSKTGTVCVTFNITVQCSQLSSDQDPNNAGQPFVSWQLSTFNTLAAAYDTLMQAHDQERAERLQSQAGPLVVGPPALNLSRAVAELKRLAIQSLLGQPFQGYTIWQPDPFGVTQPTLDPSNSLNIASSPVIQFFEQAFEWENIVYICYPYFWGGQSRWISNATSASADPVFDQLLNAGSARLVVPARPGFEHAVNYFLYTSCVWTGQNPPGPNDPGYLSVADEIQSIQVGATDGTPVYPSWEIVLPTTLLWADTDPSLPSNPNATIPPPPVPPKAVEVTLTSSANPAVFGQPVKFSVVIAAGSGSAVPTGQVQFAVDGQTTADGSLTLDPTGNATCAAISNMSVGSHSVTVNYLGDSTFGAATVAPLNEVINLVSITIALTSTPARPIHRKATTFTATVTPPLGVSVAPSGQLNFQVDGAPLGAAVTLNSGSATSASISTLTSGSHNVTVNYLGDANYAAATSLIAVNVK
jgi:hypothetical protein